MMRDVGLQDRMFEFFDQAMLRAAESTDAHAVDQFLRSFGSLLRLAR